MIGTRTIRSISIACALLSLGLQLAAEQPAPRFSPGDYVEAIRDGAWRPCIVAANYRPGEHDVPVSCGAKDMLTPADAAHIRVRKPTAEDLKIAAETASALARLPRKGTAVGARYGAREPRACASRTNPAQGAPTPQQARQYLICDLEVEGVTTLVLVTDVRVEVSHSRPFNPTTDSGRPGIDPKLPVFDIRGSFKHFVCSQPGANVNAFARTHNCSCFDEPAAQGICYRNTFGEWHCIMHDLHADILNPRQNLLPPEGN